MPGRGRRTWARTAGRAASAVLKTLARRWGPDLPRALRVAGLTAPVEVLTDEHGVPHVRGETDADVFLAMGVQHALDRFFQMDMTRRVLCGRLAETVGERPLGEVALPPFGHHRTTVDADRLMRALEVRAAAERYGATARPEELHLLEAYVRGVNAALEVLRRKPPLEYRVVRLPLEPWTLLDSGTIAKGLALGLSFKWRAAPVFAAIGRALEGRPDRLRAILPDAPGADGEAVVAHLARTGIGQALSFVPYAPLAGSNGFLLGGGRTRSGRPILVNDPHLELSLPSIWYLASLRGRRYQAVGCTLPGVPGVVIGRTPTFAWGVTNGMIDDGDLWVEEVDGDRYRVDGASRPLEVHTQEIRRRGRAPVMFRLRRTHRGPLLSDAFPGYEGAPLSLRLTLHDPAREMEAFLALGRARSVDEVPAAVEGHGAPCQNLLYADTTGRFGYRLIGRVPVRAAEAHPALPRDGRRSGTDWQGWVPSEELPRCVGGPRDQIVSANHPHVSAGYPHYLSHLYEPPHRARRLHELLRGREGLACEDLVAVQRDAMNPVTEEFRRLVLVPCAEAVRRTRPPLARCVDLLLAWDGAEVPESRGAALWHFTYNHLVRRVFGSALETSMLEAWMSLVNLVDAPLLRAFRDPESPWAPPAIRATLLGEAIDDAVRDLSARGLAFDATWGAVHVLRLRHALGSVPFFAEAFHRGPFPMRGGPYSVVSGQYLHDRPAQMLVGQSYLHMVDLADPEGTARMITFGGQSGSIGSRHYDDLTPLWREGRFLPMRLESDPEVERRLTLLPG